MKKTEKVVKNRVIHKNVAHRTVDGTETVANGKYPDSTAKHNAPMLDDNVIGFALGLTKNMGNYESLRIDVWATQKVEDGEKAEDVLDDLRDFVTQSLEETAREYDE